MDELERLTMYRQQGFYCSQMLLLEGLNQMGKSNPDLIRAMQALANGLSLNGEICGALSGGACLLGLYAGKGIPEENEDPSLVIMVSDLVDWFKSEYGQPYGGIRCDEILTGNRQNMLTRCPLMVTGVLQKTRELLVENGFDLYGLNA